MKTNAQALTLIKKAESLRLESYLCPAGKWTVGYGHTEGVKKGQRITQHQAEVLFAHDVEVHEEIVRRVVKVPLLECQFSALVSFVFNVGPGAKDVKDGFVTLKSGGQSTLLRKLNAGDYAGAAAQLPLWTRGDGQVLPGLVTRRAAERALFLGVTG